MANSKKKLSLPVILLIVEVAIIAVMAIAVFALGAIGGRDTGNIIAQTVGYWASGVTFGATGVTNGTALLIGLIFWVHVIITIALLIVFAKKSKKNLIALPAFVLGYGFLTCGIAFLKCKVLEGGIDHLKTPFVIAVGVGLLIIVAIYLLSWSGLFIAGAAKAKEAVSENAGLTADEVREIVRDELNKANLAPKAEEAPAEEPAEEDGDFLTADDIRGIIQAEVRAAVAEEMVNYQPVVQEEEPAVIDGGDDFGEDDFGEDPVVAPAEEPAPAEESAVVVAPVVEEESEESEDGEAAPGRVIIKKTFANKIKFLSDEQKEIYSRIKNELMSYKCTTRQAKMSETYRKSGIVARIVVSGKSIRVNLPLDPNDFEKYPENRYHQKDYGDKKSYADSPFGMNVKSNRAATKAIELIQGILEEKGAKKSKNYKEQDFTEELLPDGSAILEVTAQADKLVEEGPVTEEMAATINDSVLDYIPTIDLPATDNEEVSNVNVQVAAGYTTDIKRDTLRATNSWYSSVNDKIYVKSNGEPLDAVVRVECDDIDPLTAKMILMRGGKIVKINRVAKAE